MSIAGYIKFQRSTANSFVRLGEFELIELVDFLYNRGVDLIRPEFPSRYGQFLLLTHQSLLSAATLIAQGQPFDAAPVTRRAIEIARVCFASKHDPDAGKKWVAFEKRNERWLARQRGEKPPFLPPIRYNIPIKNSLLDELEAQLGILSDGFVHFTPEYYASQNWRIRKEEHTDTLKLIYFVSDKEVITREFIILADTHFKILTVIDDCLDGALSTDRRWKQVTADLCQKGQSFGALRRS